MDTVTTPSSAAGLYDPTYEHDACGVGIVARLGGGPNHEVVAKAVLANEHLYHRGATGADADTGDGAGILIEVPDAFLRARAGVELPPAGQYGVAVCFLPTDDAARERAEAELANAVEEEGQAVLGWRDVPVDPDACGTTARRAMPAIRQLFVGASPELSGDRDAFERKLYVIRRQAEKAAGPDLVIPSFSSRTVVYKGMLTSLQLARFYPDLRDETMASRVAVVHSRYSTNTFPSWELAHPYRMVAHNGEINTLMGNVNWMRARESELRSELLGEDLEKILPVVRAGGSDSATFDNVLELLVLAGRSLPHAVMMMIPEAYRGRDDVPEAVKGFYDYHACLIEPWDGPAAVAFTDGRWAGATLDRNGLRPGRWVETTDGYVVLASEAGVLPIHEELVVRKGRLQPGRLFLVDLEEGRLVPDEEIKLRMAAQKPYDEWVKRCSVHFDDLPAAQPTSPRMEPRRNRQLGFGYSQEDLRVLLAPMAVTGAEPTGSMGNDLALSVLSDRQPVAVLLLQAAVRAGHQPRHRLAARDHRHEPGRRRGRGEEPAGRDARARPRPDDAPADPARRRAGEAAPGLPRRVRVAHDRHHMAGERGARGDGAGRRADLRRGARLHRRGREHHHPLRPTGELRAGAHPVAARRRLGPPPPGPRGDAPEGRPRARVGRAPRGPPLLHADRLRRKRDQPLPDARVGARPARRRHARRALPEEAQANVVKAIGKGVLKVLSKMGISTIRSYCGAQIFEAVGLEPGLIHRHFTGTASRIGGVGIDVLAQEALDRHARGYPEPQDDLLPVGGLYQWRREGERRMWDPETIALLQHSVRANGTGDVARDTYRRFAHLVNEENAQAGMLRGLMRLREDVEPVPLEEVEPATEIVKRFSTGGMSLGALSPEAHETLAVAMNRLGGRSNTGEGGEDEARYRDERRSAIKQVASGRFGVTIDYLVNADQLQIKIAQGAKPGEGGQLPGHKVDRYIATLRHSTPGVGLISPPPHHDIYSIEDIKQLIYDLRTANPRARVSVKLVAEVGVGTVAAGVAKANADHVTIAGHDGGTGASPQSSIQHGGVPWEIGLAETQQTLLANDLRSRIIVEVDGQMRTGRDVVVGALLGADEFGFSTAPLIATGCVMMRVCHLNTCPVGVATQDPVLRERFNGTPEQVVNYLMLVAEETREIMASLGVRTMEELIGRADLLSADEAIEHWKARGVDLTNVLAMPRVEPGAPRRRTEPPPPVLDDALDWEIIEAARPAIERGEKIGLERDVRNVNRAVGGLLSSEIATRYGGKGLPEGTIEVAFHGSAGQSFAAWLAAGVTFTLRGDANDYTGKGLSGGVLAVMPPDGHRYKAEENVIIGNTVLYGATSGRAFFRGLAGERFAVRNSGVWTVVEGVGDHGCEYMTGGRVVVLGPTGRNFAAGMSGGVAYVLDEDGTFERRCNMELVGFDEVSADDARELRELVAEHAQRTGSPVAERVLANWNEVLPRFVKVMPHDYKRALSELAGEAARATPQPVKG